ncbi:MAG: hypothetical protein A2096_01785 [Spirochaetes bacterium GWF1_41_5]|nr:MAG: hypothetical protein A2096_01785 [Spirochaetes bacterium GWF1_41_5]HBE02379.1 hypothetical protein [Spirochaetia bacterium]
MFRSFFFLTVLIMQVLSFAGKPPLKPEQVLLYAEDRNVRTIAFTAFQNLSSNTAFDYLSEAAPGNIARAIKNHTNIIVQPEHYLLTYHNADLFSRELFTNLPADQSNRAAWLQKTGQSNYCYSQTNKNGDQQIIELFFTQSRYKYISPFFETDSSLYRGSNMQLFLLPENMKAPWGFAVPTEKGSFILLSNQNSNRELLINSRLFRAAYMPISEICRKITDDFIVFGDYRVEKDNYISMRIYLYEQRDQSIRLLWNFTSPPLYIFENLSEVKYHILSGLQHIPLSGSLTFSSEPPDVYVYINNIFLGRTPLILPCYPAGDYSLRLWLENYELKKKLSPDAGSASELKKQNSEIRLTLSASQSYSNHFHMEKTAGKGEFLIKTVNTPADIHINSDLTAHAVTNVSGEMESGLHFLKISASNYITAWTLFPVRENERTDIAVRLKSSRVSLLARLLFNHRANAMLFFNAGLVLSGISVYYQYRASQYYDQYSAAVSQYYNSLPGSQVYAEYYDNYSRYNTGSTRLAAAGGIAFFTSGIFYFLFKKRSEIIISTEKKPGRGIMIKYRKNIREF